MRQILGDFVSEYPKAIYKQNRSKDAQKNPLKKKPVGRGLVAASSTRYVKVGPLPETVKHVGNVGFSFLLIWRCGPRIKGYSSSASMPPRCPKQQATSIISSTLFICMSFNSSLPQDSK